MEQTKKKSIPVIKNPTEKIRKIGQKRKSQLKGKGSTPLPSCGNGEPNPIFQTMRHASVPNKKYPINPMKNMETSIFAT